MPAAKSAHRRDRRPTDRWITVWTRRVIVAALPSAVSTVFYLRYFDALGLVIGSCRGRHDQSRAVLVRMRTEGLSPLQVCPKWIQVVPAKRQ